MKRSSTPSFTAERRIYTEQWQEDAINKDMDQENRIYNNGVRHYKPLADEANEDVWLQYCRRKLAALPDDDTHKKERDEWVNEIGVVLNAYGLSEFNIHAYLIKGRQNGSCNGFPSTMTQKVGTFLWQAVKKAALRGTKIHYRKYGTTDALEGKKAGENIICKPDTGTVKYKGMEMKLKPVRKSDIWMQEALTHRVKYCRIVRRAYGKCYKYFLQLVLEGEAPRKLVNGEGKTGLDPGVSTMGTCSETGCKFDILSPEYDKYDREVHRWAVAYERRRRLANPQNYNPDGTIKKDTKTFKKYWVHTKGEKEALMYLKSACRLRTEYIKQSNNYKTNRIIEGCDTLIKEPMDYPALAKRVKETSRRDKAEAVEKKDGTVQMVHKYKRKKRFGKSILAHAPGQFIKRLEEKCKKYGVILIDTDVRACKASQLDHTTGEYKKPLLSERAKVVGGHTVQRDLYSAFLIRHALPDGSGIDLEACKRDFAAFLKMQEDAVWEYLLSGYTSRNFGMTLADIKVPA